MHGARKKPSEGARSMSSASPLQRATLAMLYFGNNDEIARRILATWIQFPTVRRKWIPPMTLCRSVRVCPTLQPQDGRFPASLGRGFPSQYGLGSKQPKATRHQICTPRTEPLRSPHALFRKEEPSELAAAPHWGGELGRNPHTFLLPIRPLEDRTHEEATRLSSISPPTARR